MATPEPATYDIVLTAGDAHEVTMEFFDDDAETIETDLSGYSYSAEIRAQRGQELGTDALAAFSTSVSGNELTLSLTAAATRALQGEGRRFFWDLQETVVSTGKPYTIFRGTVTVQDDVTQ